MQIRSFLHQSIKSPSSQTLRFGQTTRLPESVTAADLLPADVKPPTMQHFHGKVPASQVVANWLRIGYDRLSPEQRAGGQALAVCYTDLQARLEYLFPNQPTVKETTVSMGFQIFADGVGLFDNIPTRLPKGNAQLRHKTFARETDIRLSRVIQTQLRLGLISPIVQAQSIRTETGLSNHAILIVLRCMERAGILQPRSRDYTQEMGRPVNPDWLAAQPPIEGAEQLKADFRAWRASAHLPKDAPDLTPEAESERDRLHARLVAANVLMDTASSKDKVKAAILAYISAEMDAGRLKLGDTVGPVAKIHAQMPTLQFKLVQKGMKALAGPDQQILLPLSGCLGFVLLTHPNPARREALQPRTRAVLMHHGFRTFPDKTQPLPTQAERLRVKIEHYIETGLDRQSAPCQSTPPCPPALTIGGQLPDRVAILKWLNTAATHSPSVFQSLVADGILDYAPGAEDFKSGTFIKEDPRVVRKAKREALED